MVTDNNIFAQQHFKTHFLDSKQNLIDLTDQYFDDLNLENLSIDDQILLLHRELLALSQSIRQFQHQEYIEFSRNDDLLLSLFIARLYFFESDDTEAIRQGFLLCEKRNKLIARFLAAKKSLQPFTIADFVSGKPNAVFYQLHDLPHGTPEDDYYTMRSWQTKKVLDCVSSELQLLSGQFNAALATRKNKKALIEKERAQLLNIFTNYRQFTPESLIAELSTLEGCRDHAFPANRQLFYADFSRFRDGYRLEELLTPQWLKAATTALAPAQGVPRHTFPPLFCWSLIRYDLWLGQISNGSISENPDPADKETLFEQTWSETLWQCDRQINETRAAYNLQTLNSSDYIRFLFDNLDRLRDDFNRMPDPTYYNLLLNPQALKCHFLINCLFDGCDQPVQNLKNAMRINEEFNFYQQEMLQTNENPLLLKPDECSILVSCQIIDLINYMIPNPEIVGDLLKILSESTTHLRSGRKPLLFITEDLKDQLINLFEKALNNFEKLLDQHPESHKAEYVICQEKRLALKALKAQRQKTELHVCFKHLKDFLQIEIKTISSLKNCESINFNELLNPPVSLEPAKPSFGFDPKQKEKFGKLIQRLCSEIRLLDLAYSSPSELINVLTSKDFSKERITIHLGCQTNEFKYVLKCLKPMFAKLKPVAIEEYGLFYTKDGNPLKAANIYNSNDEKILSKDKIDAIFQELQ